jgi:S1-C subfamily serine protease
MKRMLLIAGSALALNGAAVNGAFAADAAPKTEAAPVVAPSTSASAAAGTAAAQAAKAEDARKQLAELRTQMQELSRKMATLSTELGEGGPRSYAYRYIGDPERAMIGVVLGMDDGHVTVGAMTPDGPAMRAGLRGSDVITAIDHQPIGPGSALELERKARGLLADLKDGQKVTIDYLRDGKKGVATVEAKRREAWNWPMLMNDDPEHPFLPKDFNERIRADVERAQREAERVYERDHERVEKQAEHATREAMKHVPNERMIARMAMPWWGLNLAPLNADLGRYFGTDKGVLVIAADNDSLPGIRAGDVITNIGGKTINRPEDALRALRDQDSGKDVAIKLLRDRKTLALNMKAPAFNSIFDLRTAPPAPVAPTAPDAPAAPPAPAAPSPPSPPVPPAIAGTDTGG